MKSFLERNYTRLNRESGSRTSAGRGWSREDLADPIRHFGALGYPIFHAIALEFDAGRISAGIVSPDYFHRPTIAGSLFLNYDHPIVRLFARTRARQTNHQHRTYPFLFASGRLRQTIIFAEFTAVGKLAGGRR
jgi:hypothetical protein